MGRRTQAAWSAEELAGVEEDMRWAGAPEAEIAAMRAAYERQVEADVFAVHPENATAVRLFVLLTTQWRKIALSGMSRAVIVSVGLDYTAIEPVARMAGLEMVAGDFERLRIMEAEALKAWSEELERAA